MENIIEAGVLVAHYFKLLAYFLILHKALNQNSTL